MKKSVTLFNIGCTSSKCGMESLISSIGDNNSNQPISIYQLQKEKVIRKNGPYPLHPATTKLLTNSLRKQFDGPGKRIFVKGTSPLKSPQSSLDIRNKHQSPNFQTFNF